MSLNTSDAHQHVKNEISAEGEPVHYSSTRPSETGVKTRNGIVLVPQPSDDPNDPLNWSQRKKYAILATLCMASFAGLALSLANQLAFGAQAKTYHKSLTQVSYTVSAAIAGIAFGPLLLNPLVHIVGCNSVIFWSLLAAAGCVVWGACMTDEDQYEPFVASRLFCGLFGAAPSIFGVRPIIDMFFLHERGRAFNTFHICYLLGTVLGPTFSGFILKARDGRGETPLKVTQRGYALAPFQIGLSPVGLMIGVSGLLSFGWFVANNTLLTVFLETPVKEGGYGFTPQRNAYFLFALWCGLGTAQLYGWAFNDRLALCLCRRNNGIWRLEYRLYCLIVPQLIILPISLGIVGAALQYHLHYMVLALGAYLLTFSSMIIVPILVNYVIECFKSTPTECGAALGAYRLSLGLAIPFFINQWAAAVGLGWVYGIMAFITIASCSVIFILILYGEKIRAVSFAGVTRGEKEEGGAKVYAFATKESMDMEAHGREHGLI